MSPVLADRPNKRAASLKLRHDPGRCLDWARVSARQFTNRWPADATKRKTAPTPRPSGEDVRRESRGDLHARITEAGERISHIEGRLDKLELLPPMAC